MKYIFLGFSETEGGKNHTFKLLLFAKEVG